MPLEGVREVRLCGDLVYQDGVVVSGAAMHRYEARTPYVGDAPALGRAAEAIGLDETNWGYTTELHTSERPYRWTVKFQKHWGDTWLWLTIWTRWAGATPPPLPPARPSARGC